LRNLSFTPSLQRGVSALAKEWKPFKRFAIVFAVRHRAKALQGVYNFTSLNNFLSGNYLTFQQAFGAPAQVQSNPNVGLFVQDEWRVRPGFTLNLGLRYDLQFLPAPIETDT
jgi:outer membrane receptor protein involved in Fe transport